MSGKEAKRNARPVRKSIFFISTSLFLYQFFKKYTKSQISVTVFYIFATVKKIMDCLKTYTKIKKPVVYRFILSVV